MEALQLRKKFPELGDGINGILGDFKYVCNPLHGEHG